MSNEYEKIQRTVSSVPIKNTDDRKVPLTILEIMANQIGEKLVDETNFSWMDRTAEYLQGKRELYLKGRNFTECFLGQTRTGKSTCALKSAYDDNRAILREREGSILPKTGEIDMFPFICSTPDEFIRLSKKQEVKHVSVILDEGIDDMGAGGISSSTDQAFQQYFTKVAAEKGVMTKICSPDPQAAKGAFLVHHTVGIHKKQGVTVTKLFLNDPIHNRMIPIGLVYFDVESILERPWYELYSKKKTAAYNLVLSEGIRSVRELEFSVIVLIAFEKCLPLIKALQNDDTIFNVKIQSAIREMKHIYSFIAEDQLQKRLQAMTTAAYKIEKSKYDLDIKERTGKLTELERRKLEMTITSCQEALDTQRKEYMELTKKYLNYLEIGQSLIVKDIRDILKKYNIEVTP